MTGVRYTADEIAVLLERATEGERRLIDAILSVPTSFPAFVDKAFPSFEWYPAQRMIADALEAVRRDDLDRLMIFMPPQEGKSLLVSELFPAYYLIQHPERWVGLGSYSYLLAKRFSRNARDYYRSSVRTVTDDVAAVERWETPRRGGMWSVGRGGSGTGNSAHLFIVDDPLKDRAEAESETIRETLHSWYGSVVNMRLQPKRIGNAVVIVHTRWHEDDLSGHLLELERVGQRPEHWHIIDLPGIAEPAHERPVYPKSCTVSPDWREPGEPLGGRYAMERYEQIRVVSGTREYESQVQQRPAPSGGTIFRRDWWQYVAPNDWPAHFDRTIISVDCSFKDTQGSDFVAIQVWGRIGPRIYLRGRYTARRTFTETVTDCRGVMSRYPGAPIYIEDKANGSAVIDSLRHELAVVVPVNPEGGKVARAYASQPHVEHGRVFLPESERDGDFVRQAASFPSAPHDDDVDAFTQAEVVFRAELREAILEEEKGRRPLTDRARPYSYVHHAFEQRQDRIRQEAEQSVSRYTTPRWRGGEAKPVSDED